MSKEWHVASIIPPPVDMTFNGKYRYQGWTPCVDWCVKQFGMAGWRFVGEGIFEFQEEKDYAWFMLRWA